MKLLLSTLAVFVLFLLSGCGIDWFPAYQAVPAAPSGVTATAGNAQVTISWSAVSGATSYNIYWATTTGVSTSSPNKITGATSPHIQTGLTNGTAYFFVVTAVSANGESSVSSQVTATPAVVAAKFTAVTNFMQDTRAEHTATLLQNGKVLIAGGRDGDGTQVFDSADLYDPATGQFSATGAMTTPRKGHTATLLSNGMVLIVGGVDVAGTIIDSAEVYDPSTGHFKATGAPRTGRVSCTLSPLAGSKVLLAGGENSSFAPLDSAEIYTYVSDGTGTFSTLSSTMVSARDGHSATVLANGKVLLAGGVDASFVLQDSAEIFDPSNNSFTATTGRMITARLLQTATLLPSGKVLIAGGEDVNLHSIPAAELYDPATGNFTATGSLKTARSLHTATLITSSGKVLFTGGADSSGSALNTAELFDPAGAGTFTNLSVLMVAARLYHTATLLSNNAVLITGGIDETGVALSSAELYQ